MDYSPWDCKELDRTEQVTRTHTHTHRDVAETEKSQGNWDSWSLSVLASYLEGESGSWKCFLNLCEAQQLSVPDSSPWLTASKKRGPQPYKHKEPDSGHSRELRSGSSLVEPLDENATQLTLFFSALHSLLDLRSSSRNWTGATAVKVPNHWTFRELPQLMLCLQLSETLSRGPLKRAQFLTCRNHEITNMHCFTQLCVW